MVSILTLLGVFILIAVRQIGKFRFQIWQIMLLGAFIVLISGQISLPDALRAIDVDVMLFLFGMFIVGQALEESGYLSHLAYRMFGRTKSLDSLVISILFGMGFLSALLMNDTIAIIGTPVMLHFATKTGIRVQLFLLVLAFAVTGGSVMSPIGNPQNLLVAFNGGVANPFVTFLRYLAVPTIINLLLTYFIVRLFYWKEFSAKPVINHTPEAITDRKLANLTKISLALIVVLVVAKISIVLLGYNIDFKLTYIALAAATPIILGSPRRFRILQKIDWATLVFFISMFVLMAGVWNAGFFQEVLGDLNLNLTSPEIILTVSVILSQFISNVPMVALYLPVLNNLGATARDMMVLAAGSTIAGNLSILGAASTIIIIQNAEKKAKVTLTFWEFIRIGIPLTVINVLVYWLFFSIVSLS